MKAIDLFASAGGSFTGAAMVGRNVVWTANH
jgi:site-specific DNA-cytosine methylase